MSVIAAVIGLVVGVVVGLTSMGGGALLTPALVLLLGIPPSVAVGSDVLIASGLKLFGGSAYALRRQVHWPSVWRLARGSVPGALLGSVLLNHIPPEWLDLFVSRGLGAAMLVTAACTILRLRRGSAPVEGPLPAGWVSSLLGFGTGLLVSLTSVGSGSLLMCVMIQFFPLPTATLVGTDLAHALFLSLAATAGHALSGRVDVMLAASVLVGGIPGVVLGARLAGVLPERALKYGLAVVLVFIGLRMTAASPKPQAVPVAVVQELAPQ